MRLPSPAKSCMSMVVRTLGAGRAGELWKPSRGLIVSRSFSSSRLSKFPWGPCRLRDVPSDYLMTVPVHDNEPKENVIKFICFGYLDVSNWMKRSQGEQNAMIDQ